MAGVEFDRGLKALVRVREVRERDSRLGLAAALADMRDRETDVTRRIAALEKATASPADTLDDYVAHRHALTAMAQAVRESRRALDVSRTVAMQAQVRWSHDRSRLEAVERLLERRDDRRREERDRAEVRELDDIVGRLFSRGPEEVAS